jgi:hypothetical protein
MPSQKSPKGPPFGSAQQKFGFGEKKRVKLNGEIKSCLVGVEISLTGFKSKDGSEGKGQTRCSHILVHTV